MIISLKERLEKAASLVGRLPLNHTAPGLTPGRCEGRVFVSDVGCDHAYLSLSLVLSGTADGAVASDVREGPLTIAKQNIIKYGCEDSVTALLTDGLSGIESYDPTDILICGMGGDTIISILEEAPFILQEGRRLILQPQTGAAELYLYLHSKGFQVYAERFAFDAGKPYRILAATFRGISALCDVEDALCGKLLFEEDVKAFQAYCLKIATNINKRIGGVIARNHDASYLRQLYDRVLAMTL